MPFDIFIFLVPALISAIAYTLSFRFKYNKIWAHVSFTVSFLFIFCITFTQTEYKDILSIKSDIENIVIQHNHEESLENTIADVLLKKHTNPIVDYTYSKERVGADDVIKITYKEKLFNGIILLQNRFYINENWKSG